MLIVVGVVCGQSPPELGGAAAQRRGGLFKDAQPPHRCREALFINRYCSSLNRPPRLCFAKAPRLTQAGNDMAVLDSSASERRGGCAIKKMSRSILSSRRRG